MGTWALPVMGKKLEKFGQEGERRGTEVGGLGRDADSVVIGLYRMLAEITG